MNAIQKFAEEHGRDIDKSLASKFQQAVESVIGDRGRVIDSWVDSTGNRLHPIEWKVSIVSDDMEDDGREICLELVTDFEGKSHFICDFWDRDSNLIASEVGEVGEFDPLPLIDKVLGKSESKKSEDYEVGSFEVKDDGIYVDGERITVALDETYANSSETATLSDKLPQTVKDRKVFVLDPEYNYYITKALYAGHYIEPFKKKPKIKVYKDFEFWGVADVVTARVGDTASNITASENIFASESKKHVCSMQKKKESLAKKNESEVSLPKDVEDAMKKVRAYLRGNYASIVDSGLVSDADCSVGYQLDNSLNVLDDIVANFPKG